MQYVQLCVRVSCCLTLFHGAGIITPNDFTKRYIVKLQTTENVLNIFRVPGAGGVSGAFSTVTQWGGVHREYTPID